MNDHIAEDLYPQEPFESVWVPANVDPFHSITWSKIHTHAQKWIRAEQLWEPLFVLLTFSLWGWYLFWLYRALQDLTFISWP